MLTHPRGASVMSGEDSVSKFYLNSPVVTTQQSPCSQGQTGIPAPHPSFFIPIFLFPRCGCQWGKAN